MKSLLNLSTYILYRPNQELYILFVTTNHQTTNLVFSVFFHEFISVWTVEKENKPAIHWSKTEKKNCFGPIKRLFSFSMAKTEKNSWKKLGITLRLFGGLMSRTRYWSLKVYKIMLKCDFMKTLAKLCQRNCFCVQTANQ